MAKLHFGIMSGMRKLSFRVFSVLFGILLVSGQETGPAKADSSQAADAFLVVDCLLPGQIRKLGRHMTFLTPRRPVRTTQRDCEIRGGEYVASDRANYATARKAWLKLASTGDAKAQTYVGEMAEKGLGQAPDYEMAALWYKRAAEQGYAPAQINLGNLYEKGLGVDKDPKTAFLWYRRASGLDTEGFQSVVFGDPITEVRNLKQEIRSRDERIATLTAGQKSLEARNRKLRRDLEKSMRLRAKKSQEITAAQASLLKQKQALEKARRALNAEKQALESSKAAGNSAASKNAATTDDADLAILIVQVEAERKRLEERADALTKREAELNKAQRASDGREKAAGATAANLDRQRREIAAANARVEEDKGRLAAREALLQQQEKALEAKRAALQSEIKSERSKNERAVADARARVSQQMAALQEKQKNLAESERELEILRDQLRKGEQSKRQQHEQALTTAEERLRDWAKSLQRQEAALKDERRVLAHARTIEEQNKEEAKKLSERQAALNERARLLQAASEELANQKAELRLKRKALTSSTQDQRRELLAELEEQKQKLVSDQKRLSAHKAELEKRESALAAKSKSLEEERKEAVVVLAEEIGTRMADINREKASLKAARAGIENRTEELKLERAQMLREISAAAALQKAEFASEKEAIVRERAQISQQTDALRQREKALIDRERRFKQENAAHQRALKNELAAKTNAIWRREIELARKEAHYAKKERQLQSLKATINKLDEEIEARRSSLAKSKKQQHSPLSRQNPDNPTIVVVEPNIYATRGFHVAYAPPRHAKQEVVFNVIAPQGLKRLYVNDKAVEIGKSSTFKSQVTLGDKATPVEIVAIDNAGRASDFAFELIRRSTEASLSQKATVTRDRKIPSGIDFGKYYALIIGNNAYENLPSLRTPKNDAKALAVLLTSKYGFDTTVIYDATRYQILAALYDMREKLTNKDNLLVYYAGHGQVDRKTRQGSWLPVDADATNSKNWISNVSITDILNMLNARKILVIADSCYSGSLPRSMLSRVSSDKSDGDWERWLGAMVTKRSRLALTSGGFAPVLDGGGGGHSIFAKALLNALENNPGVIDGRSLHERIAKSTSSTAAAAKFEQMPVYAPIRFSGHEAGDFFFVTQ